MSLPVDATVDSTPDSWWGIFARATPRVLRDKEALVVPGQALAHLVYLDSGRLRCSVVSPEGDAKTVLYLWPGELFGETHVFGSVEPLPLVVTSVGRSVVRMLSPAEAQRRLADSPGLTAQILDSIAAKTFAILEQVRQLRFLPVDARVASFLDKMYSRQDRRGAVSSRADTREKDIRLTHDEIADFVGAHRVSVTEALRRIEQSGAIETRRGRIVVKDPEALRLVVSG